MTITSKTGEELNFLETGVDGVYICERAVFIAPFDKDGCNDWEKSSGKKLLEQWFKEHAPAEIQEQFEVDLPTVEEVFSQKIFNWWCGDSAKGLVSKQFPIFKDFVERMKEFDGKPILWWTRSAYAGSTYDVWSIKTNGNINDGDAFNSNGFVPALRKKRGIVMTKGLETLKGEQPMKLPKYFRAKDGIWLFGGTRENGKIIIGKKYEGDSGHCFDKEDIVATADTVRELCDEYVATNGTDTRLIPNKNLLCDHSLTLFIEDFHLVVYGAILTEKGLLFVARRNPEKWCTELLG